MGRRGKIPEPWLRKSNATWYATVHGKQVPLGRNKREAFSEFNRVMAAHGAADARTPINDRMTVQELADLWMDDCRRRLDAHTAENYKCHVDSFVEKCGRIRITDLKVHHVNTWLNGRISTRDGNPIATSTRHLAVTVVKQIMVWGEEVGHIGKNPVKGLKRPGIDRREPITAAEAHALIASMPENAAAWFRIMGAMGVRPGELVSMVAEKTDLERRQAIVKGKRTRRNKTGIRTVYLSDLAVELLEPFVIAHAKGPLFYGRQGRPITVHSLYHAVEGARDKAAEMLGRGKGGMDHATPHCFRGLFSTEAMRNKADLGSLSKAIGHADPTMVMKHYASPDEEMLRDVAERASHTLRSTFDIRRELPE